MAKSYSIVGMQNYNNAASILAALDPGETVVLVREPKNEFDANAVAVYVGGSKVGYIPKAQNKVLAGFIDQTGRDFGAIDVPTAKLDSVETSKAIDAKFVRSPNSKYPMVQV